MIASHCDHILSGGTGKRQDFVAYLRNILTTYSFRMGTKWLNYFNMPAFMGNRDEDEYDPRIFSFSDSIVRVRIVDSEANMQQLSAWL